MAGVFLGAEEKNREEPRFCDRKAKKGRMLGVRGDGRVLGGAAFFCFLPSGGIFGVDSLSGCFWEFKWARQEFARRTG